MSKATVISIQNAKGGVGKTTISLNISHILSLAGYKVLHCDLDQQGSSTEILGAYDDHHDKLKTEALRKIDQFEFLAKETDLHNYIYHTEYNNIDILPSSRSIDQIVADNSFETKYTLLNQENKIQAFSHNLESVKSEYDYIIIDGQPSVSQLMIISVLCSDFIISPVDRDIFNLNTVMDIVELISKLNLKYKTNVNFLGFFINKYIPSEPGDKNIRKFYMSKMPDYYIDCPIRFSAPVAQKSFLTKQMFLEYSKNSNPSKDLLNLVIHHLHLIDDPHLKTLKKTAMLPGILLVKSNDSKAFKLFKREDT